MGIRQAIYDLRTSADYALGRVVFGNANRVTINARGFASLLRHRFLSVYQQDNRSMIADPARLRRSGFCPATRSLDPALVGHIQARFCELVKAGEYAPDTHNTRNGVLYRYHVGRLHRKILEVCDLLTEDVIRTVSAYYGNGFQVFDTSAWRIVGPPPDAIVQGMMASTWHCDNRPPDLLKLFINLSHVSPDDGPLHVKTRAQTRRVMQAGYKGRLEYNNAEAFIDTEDQVARLVGPPGTAMFANTELCLHRAGIPQPGHVRDIMEFTFLPAREPLSSDWWAHD